MLISQKIIRNESFRIVDEVTKRSFSYSELPEFPFSTIQRSLIFCYLNNSIESTSFLIKSLESNHVLVLLSSDLNEYLKNNLEIRYSPNYIYDATRTIISRYKVVADSLFESTQHANYELHENLKLLLSTSGTTGSPKFVKLSEKNIISNAESILEYLPIIASDRVPLNLPLYYSYGLSVLTSNALIGATLITGVKDVLSKSFWENFRMNEYSTIAGVPYVYEMLDRIGFTKMQLPSLRYFTQAGGKMRDDLVKKYAEFAQDHNKLFYVMYGQTEATARMSYLHPKDLLSHIGSIGKPIPGGKFELNDENSELQYKGPNVFGGYAECIEDLTTFVSPAFLNTGDIAKVDDQGFYYITGRSKRFVKIFGNRINLDELEAAISKQFGAFYPCVGCEDKAVWVYSTNPYEDQSIIVQWLSSEYKLHPTSFNVRLIDSIPLTANGKPDYKFLLSYYDVR